MLKVPGATSYFGAVGADQYGQTLGMFAFSLLVFYDFSS
jgi:hypothetical protein